LALAVSPVKFHPIRSIEMYDMYPSDWPSAPVAQHTAEPAAEPETSAIRAVQVALDRRDNGGAAAGRTHQ
jgi:hypothetical protein